MIYVTTTKFLLDIPEDASAEDEVVVFYKDGEVIKLSDLAVLYTKKPKMTFTMIESKEDMLLCLGGVLMNADACRILDSSITVSKRYASKVQTVQTKKSVSRGGRRRKTEPVVEEPAVEASVVSEEPSLGSMPSPIPEKSSVDDLANEEAAATSENGGSYSVVIDGIQFTEKDAADLYQLLHVKSSDIGYSWDTQMLMLNLIRYVDRAEDDEELEGEVMSMRNGSLVWSRMKPRLDEIKELVRNS